MPVLTRRRVLLSTLSYLLPPPFSDVAGLHTWVEADGVSASDGDALAVAPDLSGNGHDLIQSTLANRPLWKSNIFSGRPVLRFDGSNDSFHTDVFATIAQPNTIMLVAKATSTASAPVLFDGIVSGNRHFAYIPAAWNYGTGSIVAGPAADTALHVWAFTFDGTSGVVRKDGGASAGSGNVGTQTLTGLTLGASYVPNASWNGDIAGLVILHGPTSLTDINAIGSYWATKYGTTWTTAI